MAKKNSKRNEEILEPGAWVVDPVPTPEATTDGLTDVGNTTFRHLANGELVTATVPLTTTEPLKNLGYTPFRKLDNGEMVTATVLVDEFGNLIPAGGGGAVYTDQLLTRAPSSEGGANQQEVNLALRDKDVQLEQGLANVTNIVTSGFKTVASPALTLIPVAGIGVPLVLTETSDPHDVIQSGRIVVPASAQNLQEFRLAGLFNISVPNVSGKVYVFNITKNQALGAGQGFTFNSETNFSASRNYVIDGIAISPGDVLEVRFNHLGGPAFNVLADSEVWAESTTVSVSPGNTDNIANMASNDYMSSGQTLTEALNSIAAAVKDNASRVGTVEQLFVTYFGLRGNFGEKYIYSSGENIVPHIPIFGQNAFVDPATYEFVVPNWAVNTYVQISVNINLSSIAGNIELFYRNTTQGAIRVALPNNIQSAVEVTFVLNLKIVNTTPVEDANEVKAGDRLGFRAKWIGGGQPTVLKSSLFGAKSKKTLS